VPVNTRHPDAELYRPQWERCRAAVSGEDAVKAAGETYLPMLGDQDWRRYEAYKTRACFYNASGRTVDGMVGAIMRKPYQLTFPEGNKKSLDYIGWKGQDLHQLIKSVLHEVISLGRVGLMVDMPITEGDPFVTMYRAEDIVSWLTTMVEGKKVPTRVVLEEVIEIPDSRDLFKIEMVTQYRVLNLGVLSMSEEELVGNGLAFSDIEKAVYYVEVWQKAKDQQGQSEWRVIERVIPRMRGGKVFREIPFIFIGPTSTNPEPQKSPILDLVNVNISHYRNSADLEHGRHFTALPTPVVTGCNPDQPELIIGSEKAWVLPEPQSKFGFLEFSGQGLGHLQEGMEQKERQMAVLGARLLEEDKAAAEAAEAVRLRQSGEQSALAHVSDACSVGLTTVLQFYGAWMNIPESEAGLALNKDFDLRAVDSSVVVALMTAVQQGLMSWETFFYNMQKGELISEKTTMEEEFAKIKVGPPMGYPEPEVAKPQFAKKGA